MADADAICRVRKIIKSDSERQFIVVSAPGKRNPSDVKITDLLYGCYDDIVSKGNCAEKFSRVAERFIGISKKFSLKIDIEALLIETQSQMIAKRSRDFCVSRGEYVSARLLADILGFEFIDAAEIIRFAKNGKPDFSTTEKIIEKRLSKSIGAVIPGFYGADVNGNCFTFSRGGSDVTGAIVASGVNAEAYENWTDVNGVKFCDPKIVPNAKTVEIMTYKELRGLSYAGASVLHPESIFPLIKKKIPVMVKNTFYPDGNGTVIITDESRKRENGGLVGVVGRKNFTVLYIEKKLIDSDVSAAERVLSVLKEKGLRTEHLLSGTDKISVVVQKKDVSINEHSDLMRKIERRINADNVRIIDNVSLISVVGRGITEINVVAKIFAALKNENVKLKMIDYGADRLSAVIAVSNPDYEKSIKILYDNFNGRQ